MHPVGQAGLCEEAAALHEMGNPFIGALAMLDSIVSITIMFLYVLLYAGVAFRYLSCLDRREPRKRDEFVPPSACVQ
jgi:hypothetical protein